MDSAESDTADTVVVDFPAEDAIQAEPKAEAVDNSVDNTVDYSVDYSVDTPAEIPHSHTPALELAETHWVAMGDPPSAKGTWGEAVLLRVAINWFVNLLLLQSGDAEW